MEAKGQKMMPIMKHVNLTVKGDRNTETKAKRTSRRSRSTSAAMWRRESELAWLRGRVEFRQPCSVQPQLSSVQQKRVGALPPMPSCLGIGGHTGGSRKGHPRYTSAHTVERPWVARHADQSAVAHRHRSKKLFGIFKFYFILLLGGGASLRLLRVVLPSSALFGWRRHSLW